MLLNTITFITLKKTVVSKRWFIKQCMTRNYQFPHKYHHITYFLLIQVNIFVQGTDKIKTYKCKSERGDDKSSKSV